MSKRILTYIFLVAAAVTASCTKNVIDLPSGGSISFAPVAEKSTKAIIEGTSYPATESFVVSAYHEGSDAYFEDLEASYNNSIALWETSTAEYWPLAGSLDFIAYSPSSASGVTIDSDGVSASDYTIQTLAQMTTDLCYASATVADCSNHPESVPLVFNHALSQVVFRVKAADYYSNVSLSMTSLSMRGIYSVGDFTDTDGWENLNTEFNYALHNIPVTLTYDGSNAPVTTDICSYLFIPQELGSNAAIRVGYSVTQTISGTDYTLDNSPVTIPLGSSVTEWEAGKKYIYTLNIGLNNLITISASAVGWTDQPYEIIVEES